jgi:hypothetical protein
VVFGLGSSVPKHTETWAYDSSTLNTDCNGGYGASSSLVQQWVTYAEVACGIPPPTFNGSPSKAVNDCHLNGKVICKVIEYIDPNIIYPTCSFEWNGNSNFKGWNSVAQESWYLHQPGVAPTSATRLKQPGGCGGYYVNNANPAVQAFYENEVKSLSDFNENGQIDGLFVDDNAGSLIGAFGDSTYCQAQSTQDSNTCGSYEITTDSQLQQAHEAMAAALQQANGTPYFQVNNGIGDNPYQYNSIDMYNNPSSVMGMAAEESPVGSGSLIANWRYSQLLDDMAYVDHTTNDFIVLLSEDNQGSTTQNNSRMVQAATVLLGYEPTHIVSWSDLEGNTNNLAVWPEEGIYPTNPVQTMGAPSGTGCFAGTGAECPTGGHNDIQVATGVYRREFGQCYNQGTAFGPCAVIVNDSSSSVTVPSSWLTQSYGHQITMVGGDVQSGGTVNLAGASFSPGSTSVASGDAIMLAP